MQILRKNLALFNSTASALGVALVPDEVAGRGGTVNFAAEKDQFWGFHVLEEGEKFDDTTNMTVHQVPTKSLSQIRARCIAFRC